MDSKDDVSPVEKARLQANESLLGLSTKSGIPRTTLRRQIENPEQLTLADIKALSPALGRDPIAFATEILEAL